MEGFRLDLELELFSPNDMGEAAFYTAYSWFPKDKQLKQWFRSEKNVSIELGNRFTIGAGTRDVMQLGQLALPQTKVL